MHQYSLRAKIDRACYPQKIERLWEYLSLVGRNQKAIGYIGAIGYANLGDIALYKSTRADFKGNLKFVSYRDDFIPQFTKFLTRSQIYQGVCLGGGTLIGQEDKIFTLDRALNTGLIGFSYGTGVEEPDFGTNKVNRSQKSFMEQVKILDRLSLVSVRDQRSKEILLQKGINSPIEVIGDPALGLEYPSIASSTETGIIGINFGISKAQGSMWGTRENTIAVLVQVSDEFIRGGYQIKLFPFSWAEYDRACNLAKYLGKSATVENRYLNINSVLASMQHLDLLIGVKLHSVILAHTVNIPALMLAYQPKCSSYMDSVFMADFNILGHLISKEIIIEKAMHLIRNKVSIIHKLIEVKKRYQLKRIEFQQKVINLLV